MGLAASLMTMAKADNSPRNPFLDSGALVAPGAASTMTASDKMAIQASQDSVSKSVQPPTEKKATKLPYPGPFAMHNKEARTW
jgi:hypothetical protein